MYQYSLVIAFITARLVPLIGKVIGDYIAYIVGYIAKFNLKKKDLNNINADICYPYYYLHKNYMDTIYKKESKKREEHLCEKCIPSCPCLFMWGNKKLLKAHSEKWEESLKNRKDCKVISMSGYHWLQMENKNEINTEIEKWLLTSTF